jgi:uncharacterized membrane protein YvlD (DUF360 family)
MLKQFVRTLAIWLFISIGIIFLGTLIPGFTFETTFYGLTAVALLGLMNSLLWPLLSMLTARFLVLIFGFEALVLNGIAIRLTGYFLQTLHLNLLGFVLATVGVSVISTLISGALTIDDDASYYRSVLKKTGPSRAKKGKFGFVFLEIDGLSEEVLEKALRDGIMPTLASWLENGTYKLKPWETDLSSESGASQAGILHGKNQDIPAFRWFDKKLDRVISLNGIGDTPLIEKRISNGKGLLAVNGEAIAVLFSGDAKDKVFVYSEFSKISELNNAAWNALYSVPYNFAHTTLLSIWDILREARSRIVQRRENVTPRLHHRGVLYYLGRATSNVFLREVSTYTVMRDIVAGEKDTIYTTFLGYDEIAHHCGAADKESFYALKELDRCINRINHAREFSERPYQICILSDHGNTNGDTFKQRYGIGLDGLVQSLLPKGKRLYHEISSRDDKFGELVTEPIKRIREGVVSKPKGAEAKEAEVVVLASGNLGLIYFKLYPGRATLEWIEENYPNLCQGLASHEGIGFIMVKTAENGSVVIGARGRYYLFGDRVEGESPLSKYGERAANHLRRTDSFGNAPDILVMSLYDIERREVAAFEELISSHGGLGGDQTRAFIFCPSDWNMGDEEIVGAEKVYTALKRVMEDSWPMQQK